MGIILKIIRTVKAFRYRKELKNSNILILKNCTIDDARFENNNRIGTDCNLLKSKIGSGTYIGNNSFLPYTEIGRYCSISQNVSITIGNHPTSKFASTHPSFFSTLNQAGFYFVDKPIFDEFKYAAKGYLVKIGNDVWVGSNVTIISGVTIGDGAIIGAGAVVTKDVEPYTINIGVPARSIKKRFEQHDISYLLELKWWNKDFEWIKEHAAYFADIQLLKSKVVINH